MQTILCTYCKKPIEISQAIVDQTLEDERKKLHEQIEQIRLQEKEKTEKRLKEELLLKEKDFQNQLREDKERIERLMQNVLKANEETRILRKKDEEREIENQKKLFEETKKIQEQIAIREEEKTKLKLLEKEQQLEAMKKTIKELQRKSEQNSQQMQGEVLELEIEELLRTAFPRDVIEPVGKGITGADIRQIVKSQLGNVCGVILWESKRTKHWDDKWITKLKDDLRQEKAHVPVIVSLELPKEAKDGMGIKEGVWVCKTSLVIPLAQLLREKLYEVAREKARIANSTEKAALVYQYLTSHEFQQQVESIVETYAAMREQLQKEKTALERIWKTREAQIDKLFRGTANIIGSIEGKGVSVAAIKGLELLELGEGQL